MTGTLGLTIALFIVIGTGVLQTIWLSQLSKRVRELETRRRTAR